MGRHERRLMQGIGWHITNIAITHELSPSPTLINVIDDDFFTMQHLRVDAAIRFRARPQGYHLVDDAHGTAFDIMFGRDKTFEMKRRQIFAGGCAARVVIAHATSSPLFNSAALRATISPSFST